jgi:ATP-dependent Clp protease ATP-binding subunit ClpC
VSKRSLRVYFIVHQDGRRTGILLRTWEFFFDSPAPSAYGMSEEDVLAQLDVLLHALLATGDDSLERYLWQETFEERTITVEVHPQTALKKRLVIGKRQVPLRLSYLWSRMEGGGYRVMIPRFNWWFILEDLSIAREVLRQAIGASLLGEKPRSLYDFRMEGEEYVREWSPRQKESAEAAAARTEEFPTLRAVADELVEKAARDKLPVVIGPSEELDRAIPFVERDPPASILLVGGAGVGKSTWVLRLAKHLATQRRAKTRPRGPRLWSTSPDRILAGMIYLGMWQERCLKLVAELADEGDYLFAGRLIDLVKPQPDGSSIAEIFLPALRAEEVSLIAECTEQELEACQRRAASLVSCFQIVRIAEPQSAAMTSFLAEYEAKKDAGVHIHPAGKRRLVQHLTMFRKDLSFPGKGIRFLDWLYQDAQGSRVRTLYPRDVSEAYARYSGLPLELIADEIPASAEHLAAKLKRRVIGQPRACETAARVLARFKAGLNDPERPCGTLLFVGPTGVGKTELAKELARTLFSDERRMVRLDMSEYMLPGSAARLLEVGAGVESLAQRVRQEPLSLVLLDEIEKADAEVFDLLLGILGEGRLTDSSGRLVDFRMALIVMTSNLGVSETRAVGFGEGAGDGVVRKVRDHFRPEFFNRIDHVVAFRNLSPEDVLAIVDLELAAANARTGLIRRKVRVVVTPAARRRLAELGYHPTRGARPLKRIIEELVITPIAARMAQDPSFGDRTVTLIPSGATLALE